MNDKVTVLILRLLMHIYWELVKLPKQNPEDLPLIAEGQKLLASYVDRRPVP